MIDWLTEFPLPQKPDSWALNPIFLRKLKEMEALWRAEGYILQFGTELEFFVRESKAVRKALTSNKKKKKYEMEIAQHRLPGPYNETLKNLRLFFKTEDGERLLQETGHSRKQALAYIKRFETGLQSDDPEIVSEARKNIFLAHIHTRTFSNGGVSDIIEPRFGDKEFGIGWHDQVPEIRTRILNSPFNIITNYHKYIFALNEESAQFGLTVETTDPQYHVSIIRVKDNKNMMKMEDEESIAFCERALAGYHQILQAMPFMIYEYQLLTPTFDFHAGTARTNHVRMEPDNWEFRKGQSIKQTHAARHLMVILMGMTYGCLLQPHRMNDLLSERQSHPLVKHPSNPLSGLAAIIDHSVIAKDGTLQPDIEVIKRVLWRLTEEIGTKNTDAYTVHPPLADTVCYTLTHPYAWFRLLGELKITPDNHLDLSAIDHLPKIKAAFEKLTLIGCRTSLHVAEHRIDTELHTLKKNIRKFYFSDIARRFFTPDEQGEIASAYWKNPKHLYREAGDIVVDFLRTALPNTRRIFSKITKMIPKSTGIDVPGTFLSDRVYVTNLLWPALQVDCEDKRLQMMVNIIQTNRPVPRAIFLKQPSYFRYLKHAFLEGIDRQSVQLSQQPKRNKNLITTLNTCREFFNGQRKETLLSIETYIKTCTKDIIGGDIFREYGADLQELTRVCKGKSQDVYSLFTIALQDESYKEADIVQHIDNLVRNVEEHFVSCENLLERIPDRKLTLFTFSLYKDGVTKDLDSISAWVHQNLASPYLALPAPTPPVDKRFLTI